MENTSQTDLPGNISDFSAAIKVLEAEPGKSIQVQKLYKTAGMEILLIALEAQAGTEKAYCTRAYQCSGYSWINFFSY